MYLKSIDKVIAQINLQLSSELGHAGCWNTTSYHHVNLCSILHMYDTIMTKTINYDNDLLCLMTHPMLLYDS